MKSIIVGIFAAFTIFASVAANAVVAPAAGSTVLVNCSTFTASGSTVFSLDNAVLNGTGTDVFELPAGVAVGTACGLSLNAMNGVACATGKTWVISAPVNVAINGSKRSLQQFRFTCQ